MAYLYVFIDESGNYVFSNRGTNYLVLTSLITTDMTQCVMELYGLKHRLIDLGTDIEYFHASEDRQAVRDEVFKIIGNLDSAKCRADTLIVRKRRTNAKLQRMSRFYPQMIGDLLKYPFNARGLDAQQFDKVFIFLDRASAKQSEREVIKKAVKLYIARHLGKVPYVICMHQSCSHPYLQIVDYVSWAIFVKWERNELRPYQKIQHLIKSEFDIFKDGYDEY